MAGLPPVVLLVNPSLDDQDLYTQCLGYEGISVIACDRVNVARSQAAAADLVVTSVAIESRDDGIAFIEWLRSQPATRRKPVIVVTAHVGPEDEWRACAAGCDLFLPKPCLPETLRTAISQLLARRVRRQTESGV